MSTPVHEIKIPAPTREVPPAPQLGPIKVEVPQDDFVLEGCRTPPPKKGPRVCPNAPKKARE